MKTCCRCKLEKELTNFSRDKAKSDGLQLRCKQCQAVLRDRHYKKNKDSIAAKRKKKIQDNPEAYRAARREYDQANVERRRARQRARYPKAKHMIAAYRAQNRTRIRANARDYYSKRYKADPLYKLENNLRWHVRNSFAQRDYSKTSRTHEVVGADFATVYAQLVAGFAEVYGRAMTTDDVVDIDHIIPLSLATTEDELLRLNHYTNLRFLLRQDNKQKGDLIGWEPQLITYV